MRPVNRGDDPVLGPANYAAAREPLAARLGYYCSYCGVSLHTSAEVEHVRPKVNNPELLVRWSNLLLACKPCNTTKSRRNPGEFDVFWPDRDNTQRAFVYGPQALIGIHPDLNEEQRAKAQATLDLTGLDRSPLTAPNLSIDRWRRREIVWQRATASFSDFIAEGACSTSRLADRVVDLAVEAGIWSIWMTVFRGHPAMLRRFNQAFPGTAQDCFDEELRLLPRPGGLI